MALSVTLLGGLGRYAATADYEPIIREPIIREPIYTEPVVTAPSEPAPIISPILTTAVQPLYTPLLVASDPVVTYDPPPIAPLPIVEPAPIVQPVYTAPISPTVQQEPTVYSPTGEYDPPTYEEPTRPTIYEPRTQPVYEATISPSVLQPYTPAASTEAVSVQPFPYPVPSPLPPFPLPELPPAPVPPAPTVTPPAPTPPAQPVTAQPTVDVVPGVPAAVVPVGPQPLFRLTPLSKIAIALGVLGAVGYGVHRYRKRRR